MTNRVFGVDIGSIEIKIQEPMTNSWQLENFSVSFNKTIVNSKSFVLISYWIEDL